MSSKIRLGIAAGLEAFEKEGVIGTKILDLPRFLEAVYCQLEADIKANPDRALRLLQLDRNSAQTVSADIGYVSREARHYFVRVVEGKPTIFLRRWRAAETLRVDVCVQRRQEYLDSGINLIEARYPSFSDCTHIITAVSADVGAFERPASLKELVQILYDDKQDSTGENAVIKTIESAREWATSSIEFWKKWCLVADDN